MAQGKSSGNEIRSSLKSEAFGLLAGSGMRILCSTYQYEVVRHAELQPQSRPAIYVIWHNRILAAPEIWRNWQLGGGKMSVLTSASRDGSILSRAVSLYNFSAVRGSSSRRGLTALLQLKRALDDGQNLCIAPDGPRGPRYECQEGVLRLAAMSGYPIVPVTISFSDCWRLKKAWDKFCIPKPLSKVRCIMHRPIAVDKQATPQQLEQLRQQICALLNQGTPDFEDW